MNDFTPAPELMPVPWWERVAAGVLAAFFGEATYELVAMATLSLTQVFLAAAVLWFTRRRPGEAHARGTFA